MTKQFGTLLFYMFLLRVGLITVWQGMEFLWALFNRMLSFFSSLGHDWEQYNFGVFVTLLLFFGRDIFIITFDRCNIWALETILLAIESDCKLFALNPIASLESLVNWRKIEAPVVLHYLLEPVGGRDFQSSDPWVMSYWWMVIIITVLLWRLAINLIILRVNTSSNKTENI